MFAGTEHVATEQYQVQLIIYDYTHKQPSYLFEPDLVNQDGHMYANINLGKIRSKSTLKKYFLPVF